MASLTQARNLYRKASSKAESGDILTAAQLELAAFKQARASKAKGSEIFAYRMWNAAMGAATFVLAHMTEHKARSEAGRIVAELKLTGEGGQV